jgi:hypothetical protein
VLLQESPRTGGKATFPAPEPDLSAGAGSALPPSGGRPPRLRSGAVYDALHLVTAEVEAAELFLTFHIEDFTRLSEPGGPRIVAPPDPRGMPPPPG